MLHLALPLAKNGMRRGGVEQREHTRGGRPSLSEFISPTQVTRQLSPCPHTQETQVCHAIIARGKTHRTTQDATQPGASVPEACQPHREPAHTESSPANAQPQLHGPHSAPRARVCVYEISVCEIRCRSGCARHLVAITAESRRLAAAPAEPLSSCFH